MENHDFFTDAIKDAIDTDALRREIRRKVADYIDYEALADYVTEQLKDIIQDTAEEIIMDILLPF